MKTILCSSCILFLFFLSGCTQKQISKVQDAVNSGVYSSKFPVTETSGDLSKISRFVKKVYSVSTYTTYQFRRESKITGYHISGGQYKKAAWGIITTSETASGTATIIDHSVSHMALLTCAHIVHSPDTLITWFEPVADDPLTYVQSFSVKEKQENWVKDLSPCGPFTILAADNEADIAILGKKCDSFMDTVTTYPYHCGRARELGWGCFVYIFGYPFGNQMVTSGIVSLLPKRPCGEFTVDALLNKGFSGGILLALRKDIQAFELVGMVKTVNSSREDFLKPAAERNSSLDFLPYKGEVFVGKSDIIQYGINSVVPMEAMTEFYQKNRPDLIRSGYNLDVFFNLSR